MATAGWGVDPTIVSGAATSGTTSSDVRKVWGALYTPGVVSGAVVTTSSSALGYSVSAGVVAIPISTGEVVLAPVEAQSVATTSVASGTRKDIVYAKQNVPGTDSNSLVTVGVATVLPARAVALATYTVAAGNTKSSQFVLSGSTNYSIPYGTSGAPLHSWRDTSNAIIASGTSDGHGTFSLPTDRRICISVDACISSNNGTKGYVDAGWTEARYAPYVDGVRMCQWYTPPLTAAWATYHFENYFNLSAGQHTVYLGFDRQAGPAYPMRHYAGENAHPGTLFLIRDAGVIQ